MSLTIVVVVVVGAIAAAAAAIYLAAGRADRRSSGVRPAPTAAATGAVAGSRDAESAPVASALDPKTLGRLRAGREEGRLSEDDIARQRMGGRGRPGEPLPAYDLGESETQIPKPLDPGHTA
ncbi:MAG TPA: hypothetical protein VH678_18385 [Xanthobacteraceae bacterium]|jgi:hypothetical protein